MRTCSESFADGGRIPGEFAFEVLDPAHRTRRSANRNPHLAWDGAPSGTRQRVDDRTAWFGGDHGMEGGDYPRLAARER